VSYVHDQQSLTTSSHQPSQQPAIVDQPSDVIPPINPVTEGSEPHQLQFYEPAVRDILERAKQFSHCDIASVNAFPLRSQFNDLAHEYVEEAIDEKQSRGLFVPDGKCQNIVRAWLNVCFRLVAPLQ
jgi:hypothetical protein